MKKEQKKNYVYETVFIDPNVINEIIQRCDNSIARYEYDWDYTDDGISPCHYRKEMTSCCGWCCNLTLAECKEICSWAGIKFNTSVQIEVKDKYDGSVRVTVHTTECNAAKHPKRARAFVAEV